MICEHITVLPIFLQPGAKLVVEEVDEAFASGENHF